jgi:nicotinate-nucleotide adenylyltransferase
MSARRVGILGGTFDPFHCGHLDLGRAAERALGLSEVIVITSNIPPHRPPPIASSYHRFAMSALSVSGLDRWRASDMELGSGARSFTIDTLRALNEAGCSPSDLVFVIGADAFADIMNWKDYPGVLDRAHFAVVSRPHHTVRDLPNIVPELESRMAVAPAQPSRLPTMIYLIDAPTADVSSTAIRHRLARGEPIAGLVPPLVQRHIEQHGLYAPTPSGTHSIASPSVPSADRLHGEN